MFDCRRKLVAGEFKLTTRPNVLCEAGPPHPRQPDRWRKRSDKTIQFFVANSLISYRVVLLVNNVDLFYCDCRIKARLRTYDSRYMAASRRIVCQKNIAGTETQLGAIADLHLTVTG